MDQLLNYHLNYTMLEEILAQRLMGHKNLIAVNLRIRNA